MKRTTARPRKNYPTSRKVDMDPHFAAIVRVFARHRRVTYGGQGFGSRALKCDGRIFAMLSSKGRFVVKLPGHRVAELIRMGKGEYFDTGRNRVMKEWLAVAQDPASWLALARDALRFAAARRD